MLQNILNLEGVDVLNKKEQSAINGASGDSSCYVLIFWTGGGQKGLEYEMSASGAAASTEADGLCADAVNSGDAASCQYDCYHDGYTGSWNPMAAQQ